MKDFIKFADRFSMVLQNNLSPAQKLAGSFMFGQRIMEHKDVLIMPNAIEAETYAYDPMVREEVRQELGIQENFVICHVGRIAHQKIRKV